MRFIHILLQWFSNQQPDPDNKETKKAVIQLLLVDNFIVLLLSFVLGMLFAINYPTAAEEFLQLFSWISREFNT